MKLMHRIASSLRAKLLLMFVVFTCLPLIVVGLISYQMSYNTVLGNSKAAARLATESLATHLDTLFQDTGKLLELEKNSQVLQFLFTQNEHMYANAKDILKTIVSYRQTYQYENVLNITMLNTYGRGISERKGVFQLARNPLRNPHFAYLMEHPDAVLYLPASTDSIERIDGFTYLHAEVITIMATVKQRVTHEVIGFIVIDLDDSIVKRYCESSEPSDSGYFFVADAGGEVIFAPAAIPMEVIPDKERLQPLLLASDEPHIDTSQGKPQFMVASTSTITGWRFIGVAPLQEIVKEANAIRQLIIVSVALCIVFAVTLHFFVSIQLTKSIHVLKKKMQLAADGFLEAKVHPRGSDEIADLGKNFNIMLAKIRTLLDQSIKEQQEIKKAEMRVLQAQIHPHFLYNTLESIVWMAEAERKEEVIRLVLSLSRFFRISLSKGQDFIPLAKELEHLESYLTIQHMRYRDILSYSIAVDEALYPCSILKMTLQPIVENALYHGIKNKRGLGRIEICGKICESKDLLLTVTDNGPGMSRQRLEQVLQVMREETAPEETGNEVSGGFGLHNVHQRIRLYYGESYGVDVASEEQTGTVVSIRIPMVRSEPGEEGHARR